MPKSDSKLSILLASPEVVGFAKTGGLAEVCGYLPAALSRLGHQIAVIMPLYRIVRQLGYPMTPIYPPLSIPMRGQTISVRLWKAQLPNSEASIYFVEHPDLFERDDPTRGRGIYQFVQPDGKKIDYPDNCGRYSLFCRAVMEAIPLLGMNVDILHANDWQTGLLPVYLQELYQHRPGFRQIRCLLTIHNLAYQGVFKSWEYPVTGLSWKLFNHQQLEFYGHLNFLKAGLVFADWINTVSPTYSKEIQTPEFGCGLEGVLSERTHRLSGIVNGVDYHVWNSQSDMNLPERYDRETFAHGKAICKAKLQEEFQLPVDSSKPILGMIARLVEQKGISLVLKGAESIFSRGVQIIILGEGDAEYHKQLKKLKERYPHQLGLYLGFDEGLAHRVEAGSDLYLMPSSFEPSGLNQLYSLRYGTPPIVRATGGLADTIVDTTPETIHTDRATGFHFKEYTTEAFLSGVHRALDFYWTEHDRFRQIIRCGMRQDWSWDRSAKEYESLFYQMVQERNKVMKMGGKSS